MVEESSNRYLNLKNANNNGKVALSASNSACSTYIVPKNSGGGFTFYGANNGVSYYLEWGDSDFKVEENTSNSSNPGARIRLYEKDLGNATTLSFTQNNTTYGYVTYNEKITNNG